jgi:SlyX protein
MKNRMVELETRIAFQEHTLQDLDAVVVRQQQDILRLERELATLKAQLRALVPPPVTGHGEEPPPPHY